MFLKGQHIGHYRLICPLGSGGMGEVYLAADTNISRRVVLKVLGTDPSLYESEEQFQEAVRLFRREARAVALLDHPHILPLLECGQESFNGTTFTYLVMPYRPEGSLEDVIRHRKPPRHFSQEEVAHIVSQAAEALEYAHAHQIIHRDVKPSNFLLRKRTPSLQRPDLLLADFGIAKLNSRSDPTTGTTIRGTAAYMAPEQWEGRPVPQTDQYALAVMAYELLTGRPPFVGDKPHLMYQHFHAQPKAASRINPQVCPELDAVLLRALAKNPVDRFPSISAFAQAFQQAVSHAQAPLPQRTANPRAKPRPGLVPNNARAFIKPQHPHLTARAMWLMALLLLLLAGSVTLFSARNSGQTTLDWAHATGTAQAQETAMAAGATGTPQVQDTATSQAAATATAQPNAQATATAQANAHASATAQALTSAAATAQANAYATSTAQANAYATAIAQENAYATAIAQATATAAVRAANPNPYPPYGGTLVLSDPLSQKSPGNSWDDGTANCAFTRGAYHVMEPQKNLSVSCTDHTTHFTNFVYEVEMTISSGDCGALIFRADTANAKLYDFRICQDQTYAFFLYTDATHKQTLKNASSSAITSGVNRPNLIAIVANGNTIDLYVNRQKIDGLTENTYSTGQIGLGAESPNNPTEVVYNNLKVWAF